MRKRKFPAKERFVYFIATDGAPSRVKIGVTWNVETRLKNYQPLSPYKLYIAAKVSGDLINERFVQWRFRDLRVHGEWFKYAAVIQDAVDYIVQHGALPDKLSLDKISPYDRALFKQWVCPVHCAPKIIFRPPAQEAA